MAVIREPVDPDVVMKLPRQEGEPGGTDVLVLCKSRFVLITGVSEKTGCQTFRLGLNVSLT